MKFSELTTASVTLAALSSRNEMVIHVAQVLAETTPDEARIIAYYFLGEIRPAYRGGTLFNLAERSLDLIVAEMLALPADEYVRRRSAAADLGDLIAQGTWQSMADLSVTEVYHELVGIEAISGTGSQELRAQALKALLHNVRPADAAWIIRMISGKLRLGCSDMTVLDACSWMLVGNKSQRAVIERAYNLCADIGELVASLKREGIVAAERARIVVGIPIRPAAAERLVSAEEIIEKIGPCDVQPKLDGFRVQVHIEHDDKGIKITCFSRNLQPLHNMFPDLEAALQHLPVRTAIVEGEALAYDPHTGVFLPFQETVKRRRKHNVAEVAVEYPLQLYLFDILYCDDVAVFEEPHHLRHRRLVELLVRRDEKDTCLMVIPQRHVTTTEELQDYFIHCIDQGLEGIIAKRDDAPYDPGKRNFTWIKLKRQEVGELSDTVDAVIVGYYRGRGKRAALGIGALLVAVYDTARDLFVTVAKIGTGLTDDEWRDVKQHADRYVSAHQSVRVDCPKALTPDVWVEPAVILSLAADEITRSPVHTAGRDSATGYGYALRFPRMESFRPDKSAEDATTVVELLEMFKQQFRKE